MIDDFTRGASEDAPRGGPRLRPPKSSPWRARVWRGGWAGGIFYNFTPLLKLACPLRATACRSFGR